MGKAPKNRRRSLGLCIRCGDDAAGHAFCHSCVCKNEARRRAVREARKAASICTICRKPAPRGRATCDRCSRRTTRQVLRRYHRNVATGCCGECGQPAGKRSRCRNCLEQQQIRAYRHYDKAKAQGTCHLCGRPTEGLIRCPTCDQQAKDRQKVYRQALRDEVFAAYGGPTCVGCGFDADPDLLQMDHVGGGGNAHRREIGNGRLYIWLKKNGFPAGFRVLCAMCNLRALRKKPLPLELEHRHGKQNDGAP